MNVIEFLSGGFAICSLIFALFVYGVMAHHRNTIKNENIRNEKQ